MEMTQKVTDLLRTTFSSQFVFPALGHDDPSARKELGKMWSQWLPTDAMRTFEMGKIGHASKLFPFIQNYQSCLQIK